MSKNTDLGNLVNGLFVSSTKNVGIGTTTPTDRLTVAVSANGNIARFDGLTSGLIFQTNAASTDIISYGGSTPAYRALNFATGASTNMTITTAGNVGIGTTSLSASTNYTALNINGTNGSEIYLKAGNVDYGYIYANTGVVVLATQTAIPLTFQTNATERMRITSGGNVLIGTTTVAEKLTVNGGMITFGSSAIVYIGARDGSVNYGWYAENSSFLYFYNNSTNSVTGQFARTTGVYTALSDINKKKDFEQSTIGLNEVLQLKPTLYRMKTDDGLSAKELGFIAQEVKELIPQAYSESGEGDDKFIGLNQMPLIAALTKAIQELSAEVQLLKNK